MTSGVPSSRLASTRSGRSGSGCAITWLEMSTSSGTGSPAKGLLSGNGRSRRGAPQDIAPPIDRPPARSRTGSSGSSSSWPTPDCASRGPAKRIEEPTLLDPGLELGPLRVAERADVGEDQHVGRGVQHLAERRLDHLGEGLRAPSAGSAADRPGPGPRRRAAPDISPTLRRRTESSASTTPAAERPSASCTRADPVAELDRHVEREVEHVLAGGEARRRPSPSARSIPFGSGPSATTADRARRPRCPARSTPTLKSPSSSRGGVSASAVCARRRPASPARGRAAPAPARPRRRGRSRRSSHSVSKRSSCAGDPASAQAGARPAPRPTARARPAARSTPSAARHGSPRPPAAAPPSAAPPPAGRRGRRRRAPPPPGPSAAPSPARRPSRRRAGRGAGPSTPPGRGFSTGPAKARIAAASASIRRRSSHQGVRSGIFSGSRSPRSSRTPGKALRPGAGGTARSSHQSTGSAAKPEPAATARGRRPTRSSPLTPARPPPCRARAAPAAAARWYGGSTSASRGAGRRSTIRARRSASRSA